MISYFLKGKMSTSTWFHKYQTNKEAQGDLMREQNKAHQVRGCDPAIDKQPLLGSMAPHLEK